MAKRIVILNGGPRQKGNTSMLVKAFTEGAEGAGHTVTEFSWAAWTSTAAGVLLASVGTAARSTPASSMTIDEQFIIQWEQISKIEADSI